MSTQKTSIPILSVEELGSAIAAFRKARGWNQGQLAEACGVTQSQVSLWEKGKNRPSPAALIAISKLADEDAVAWWLAQAGVTGTSLSPPKVLERLIPVLRDAAAAGTPRAIDDGAVEMNLNLPSALFPLGGKIYGLKVEGDSMSPILESGYIVFVDVTEQEPEKLAGKMVAARDADGVTIKWLRKQGKLFLLVPQHVSPRHEVRVIEPGSEISIVGSVVKWLGEPPPPPTTRSSRRK